ncbi:FANCD2 opposite strand protein [Cygnus olor]|uniref:FANCD2 opposite strand protein n=1 Tax=Cygnus olor TaxID=8869 RepID=UPI001ADE7E8E|nr:FANCD2 opposite strand protein [Cygnus olor]
MGAGRRRAPPAGPSQRPRPGGRRMAGGYQLWAPRSPLDEALRWLRGAPPPAPQAAAISAHPFRGACLPPLAAAAAGGLRGRAAALRRPQAVRLRGLDAVFGRPVTAQPPRWSGSLRVSERSAFCRVVAPRQPGPGGLREAEARLAAAMCRRMLRAILLLYAAYKKCAFALQHSR